MNEPAADQGAPAPGETMPGPRRRFAAMVPLLAFLVLSGLFAYRLYIVDKNPGSISQIPSALINKPVPEFDLPQLAGVAGDGLNDQLLGSGLHVVNIWASWCQPCRAEHPVLMELAKDERFQMAGLNYKDIDENARRFLGNLGNPYRRIGSDPKGRSGIDWGVYGVPETFIVKDGVIVYKFIGPLSEITVKSDFLPAIEKAISGQTE
jgi:cytochrome c biogenesis protein CcmG/thiol:disulfide interchange protein DsbE